MSATEVTAPRITGAAALEAAAQRISRFLPVASPWLVGSPDFILGPTIASFVLSFTEYPLIVPPTWIGLANYTNMSKMTWSCRRSRLLLPTARGVRWADRRF